jgi:N-acetylglucosamine kinase-like BadF-type ATPase
VEYSAQWGKVLMTHLTSKGNILLAVDGGGTRTRCAAYTLDGLRLASAEGGPSNHLSAERSHVLESLQTTLPQTLRLCDRRMSDVLLVSAGFAGVDFDGAGASEMKVILSEAGFDQTLIHGDMVTAHAGALDGRPGVLALAGTGSAFFGISPVGDRLKLGGFGYAFGDEGGGYWIATQALRAASRAYDQRGEATALVESLCKALRVSDFSRVPRFLYSGDIHPAQIARLSLTVEAVATGGDQVAINILEQAGHELVLGAVTLVGRLKLSLDCVISYYGSILQQCPFVLKAFNRELQLRLPFARVAPPISDALYGAYLLGKRVLEVQT